MKVFTNLGFWYTIFVLYNFQGTTYLNVGSYLLWFQKNINHAFVLQSTHKKWAREKWDNHYMKMFAMRTYSKLDPLITHSWLELVILTIISDQKPPKNDQKWPKIAFFAIFGS